MGSCTQTVVAELNMKSFVAVLACVASASAAVIPAAGLGYAYPNAYGYTAAAPLAAGYGYAAAPVAYAAQPVAYAQPQLLLMLQSLLMPDMPQLLMPDMPQLLMLLPPLSLLHQLLMPLPQHTPDTDMDMPQLPTHPSLLPQ